MRYEALNDREKASLDARRQIQRKQSRIRKDHSAEPPPQELCLEHDRARQFEKKRAKKPVGTGTIS